MMGFCARIAMPRWQSWLAPSACVADSWITPLCSNEYVAELGKLEAAKDDMIGGGQPVELAVELLRCVVGQICCCSRLQRAF